MSCHIALFAAMPAKDSFCRQLLADHPDVELESFASVPDFLGACNDARFNGFVVDIPTLMGFPAGDKKFVYGLDSVFPVLFVGLGATPSAGTPRSPAEAEREDCRRVGEFVNGPCRSQPARGIRRHPRRPLYLNVLLGPEAGAASLRTNTLDVSAGGCFVLTGQPARPGDLLYLVFSDIADPTPIPCRVRWTRAWGGGTDHLPGVGVQFGATNGSLQAALDGLLAPA